MTGTMNFAAANFAAATLSALLLAVPFAHAQQGGAGPAESSGDSGVVDMSTVKCSDLLAMSNDDALITLVWMKGFYSGVANDTTWNRPQSLANAKRLVDACKQHSSLAVMTVIEQEPENGDDQPNDQR